MRGLLFTCLGFGVALACWPAYSAAETDADRIDHLVRQLGSEKFEQRETASKALAPAVRLGWIHAPSALASAVGEGSRRQVARSWWETGLALAIGAAGGLLPPGTFGAIPYAPYPFDLNKAKQFMQASGLPTPVKLSLIYGGNGSDSSNPGALTAQIYQQTLNSVGFDVSLQNIPGNDSVNVVFQQAGAPLLAARAAALREWYESGEYAAVLQGRDERRREIAREQKPVGVLRMTHADVTEAVDNSLVVENTISGNQVVQQRRQDVIQLGDQLLVDVEVLAVTVPPAAVEADERHPRFDQPPGHQRLLAEQRRAVAVAHRLRLAGDVEEAVAGHETAHPGVGVVVAGQRGVALPAAAEAARQQVAQLAARRVVGVGQRLVHLLGVQADRFAGRGHVVRGRCVLADGERGQRAPGQAQHHQGRLDQLQLAGSGGGPRQPDPSPPLPPTRSGPRRRRLPPRRVARSRGRHRQPAMSAPVVGTDAS